jgi:hypothetical protein
MTLAQTAVANLSASAWEAMVTPHFGYLRSRYDMRVMERNDRDWWETSITYGRDPVAVIVRYSVEFNRAEVELIRLVDGKVPPVPIFIHPDTHIDRSLLDNLFEIRSPSALEPLAKLGRLDKETLERSLAFQAKALEEHGADLLRGDTAVFQEFDRLIKGRVAQTPQRIKMSFPEGTSQEEIDRSVARAKRVDPRVPIDVQFYNRPTRPRRRRRFPWDRSVDK